MKQQITNKNVYFNKMLYTYLQYIMLFVLRDLEKVFFKENILQSQSHYTSVTKKHIEITYTYVSLNIQYINRC